MCDMGETGRPTPSDSRAGPEGYAHRFGASPPLSLGVEEELLLVDDRRDLVSASDAVLDAVPPRLAGRVSSEVFSEQIELKTGVCHDAVQVLDELREARRMVREAGFNLMGSGLHPTAGEGEPRLVSKQRYEVVRRDLGEHILRTPPCGLHVHVGIPDPDVAVRIANSFRLYLPAVQALSANSPFREGTDTGHASARTSVVRSYPRFQVPRQFRDYEDFCRVADQLMAAAGVDDYTYIWWDVRPHPKLGTVEVRAFDVHTTVAGCTAIAALIQAIAAKELEEPSAPGLYRESLEESYFQAASHGLEADILLDADTPEPARPLIRRMLDSVRPYARELAADDALEEIERILREGNGADDQRRVQAGQGMDALLDHLAERTTC
jgi:glutamate---cysteine ligase / carboxylate-amine ligase